MSLAEKVQDETVRSAIAADCTQLIDKQVSTKGGLSGIALKGAYKIVKGVDADYIPGAISRLLPETCAAIEPVWQEGVAAGDPVGYMSEHCERSADLILSTTDAKIARVGKGVVSATYNKLRQSIKPDVESAVPELAQILNKHVR